MRGFQVSLTVPEQVYNDLRGMDDAERRRLREKYPDLHRSHDHAELWLFEQLVGASGEELYGIPAGEAVATSAGRIEASDDQSRDSDGNFAD